VPKRFRTVLVTLPILVGLFAMPTATAIPGVGPCDLAGRSGEAMTHLMKRRITCAADRFGPVPGGAARAICIAKRESGLDPTAASPTGRYQGLFQHARKYWPSRYTTWTRESWQLSTRATNGRSNSIVTLRMVHAAGSWKAAGWPATGC
jgi:hypothetical protein